MLANHKNNSTFGVTKIHLATVDSTNNYTANLLKEQLIGHGTVILADEQTNGRGQRGASWQSEKGKNLLFSLLLFPKALKIENQINLNFMVCNALIQFLQKNGVNAKVKWPNDILVQNKKIAGVLIENQISKENISSAIIGIGFNVNQISFQGLNATSLHLETQLKYNLNEILNDILFELKSQFEILEIENFKQLKNNYMNHLWGFQERKKFTVLQEEIEGSIVGISKDGKLILQMDNGTKNQYDLKEIAFHLED